MNDDEILKTLEESFIQMKNVKVYVKEQLEQMKEFYPKEKQGILVLNYLHNIMLKFLKD